MGLPFTAEDVVKAYRKRKRWVQPKRLGFWKDIPGDKPECCPASIMVAERMGLAKTRKLINSGMICAVFADEFFEGDTERAWTFVNGVDSESDTTRRGYSRNLKVYNLGRSVAKLLWPEEVK